MLVEKAKRIAIVMMLFGLAPVLSAQRTPRQEGLLSRPGNGVIMGYVYWDANRIHHVPPNNCDGLAVTVRIAGASTPIGTFTNNISYIPNVGADGVCMYGVRQMPIGQDLQVQIDVTTPAAFSPTSTNAPASNTIKISGEECNNFPPAVPSPSVLSSNWWACGDYAYNVNFVLTAPSKESFSRIGRVHSQPSPPNGPLLSGNSQKTMLGTQPTMLDGGKGAVAGTVAITNGTFAGSVRPAAAPQIGTSHTMSAQGNISGSLPGQQSITSAAMEGTPVATVWGNPANPGFAQGYIFWDPKDFQYNASTVCQKLTVRITGAGSDNQLKYITAGPYVGCAYSMGGVPEGQDIKLRIHFSSPSPLTPSNYAILVTEADLAFGVLILPGPACSNTPPTDPTSPTQVCGDYIYNLNNHLYNQALGAPPDRPARGTPRDRSVPLTRVNGPVRVAPGTPVQSGASRGTLLSPGPQQTMLGSSSSAGNGSSGTPAVKRQAITDRTLSSGIRPAGTPQAGVSQTMSATTTTSPTAAMLARRAVTTASATPRSMSSLAAIGSAPSQVNLEVAEQCAKDPSYRILSVSSPSFTVGPQQYALWGCAFGAQANVKAPMPVGSTPHNTLPSINHEDARILVSAAGLYGIWFVKCNIQSWTDNAIVVTIDAATAVYPGTGPSPAGQDQPAELWLRRADGQITIWGHEGGFSFKPIK